MAETTGISWTDSTWNPWIGCTKISPACDSCYAEVSMVSRFRGIKWGAGQQRARTADSNWGKPMVWQRQAEAFYAQHGRRRRVFCASLADWLDNEIPIEWFVDLLNLIRLTPDLDWLLLSKRIGNWRGRIVEAFQLASRGENFSRWPELSGDLIEWLAGRPPANVWLGATVVNQPEYDRDIGKLLRTPAAVHFLSMEPLLSAIDMRMGGASMPDYAAHRPLKPLDWVIVGGESGPKARPMHPDWVRAIRDQCLTAGVPFHLKQWGAWAEQDAGPPPHTTLHMDSEAGQVTAAACDGFISLAGEFVSSMDDATTDEPYRGMVKVGVKAAGRVLDGMTHDGFPLSPAR